MAARRFSRQREQIYQALCAAKTHPSAQMVYDDLKKDLPKLSLGTVYRNLNQLAEYEEISKITGLDGSVHFDHNTHKHFHFICNKCNKVYDIPAEVVPSLEQKVKELTGLDITECELVLRGTCKDCQIIN